MRPPPNAWREVWDCMELPCQQELTLIETDTLDDTLETYLRKHRYIYLFMHLFIYINIDISCL